MWQKIRDRYTTWRVKSQLTTCGKNLRARNPGLLFLGEGSEVHVGDNVLLERDVRISTGANARVYIGDNSYLGDGCNLLAVKELRIGKKCSISWHVLFMDTSSHPLGFAGEIPETKIAPIVVEDHVWIGCRAVILKGVTVGTGSIIANNAVVTKDVPPRTMVAGNPARVIKEDVIWE
jgi:acetyltransferase-like isoleucine patch superfamily enzyme